MLKEDIFKPKDCHCNSSLSTVIIGSFRKHLEQALRLKRQLENHQIKVLSPSDSPIINPDDEFVIFSSDPVMHPKLLQDSVFNKIRHSTFIVVVNVNGYIGKATLIEIGYAIAAGIDIYTLEPVDDPHLIPYCKLLSNIFPNISISSTTEQDWDYAYKSISDLRD